MVYLTNLQVARRQDIALHSVASDISDALSLLCGEYLGIGYAL